MNANDAECLLALRVRAFASVRNSTSYLFTHLLLFLLQRSPLQQSSLLSQ